MELTDYVRILRKNWVILAVTLLVGAVGGGAVSVFMPNIYLSATQLYVSVQSADSNSTVDAIQGSNAAQQKVKSYVDVATSARVLVPVIEELGLDLSTGELEEGITVSSPTNSVLVDIVVSDLDADRAAAIANALGRSLTKVVTQLETPISGGTSLVKIESIEPAKTAAAPSSPRIPLNIAVGSLAGLLIGISIAALRTALDTRVHGVHDLEALTDRPVLGGIAFDPETKKRPLVVAVAPTSPRAETFRALRTNLQFIGLDSSSKIFMTTSAMPSEGKTTTTANLAIALAESGASVVLVDGDLRRPRVAELLGLEGAVGLTDVLIRRAELDDVLQQWGDGELTVLPSGSIPPNPSELLGSPGMKAVLNDLATRFDFVLIDAPPVLPVTDAAVLSSVTDGAIVVARAGRTTRAQVKTALGQLERVNARILGTVVTMLPTKGANAYGYGHYDRYYGTAPEKPAEAPPRAPGKRAALASTGADVR